MRLNNLSKFFIQRPGLVHNFFLCVASSFFVSMIVWGLFTAVDFVSQIIHENRMYKAEKQIEANQLYVRLTVDKVAEQRKEDERKKAIADLCKRDKQGCRIILTR